MGYTYSITAIRSTDANTRLGIMEQLSEMNTTHTNRVGAKYPIERWTTFLYTQPRRFTR